jgi:hypothetical protein
MGVIGAGSITLYDQNDTPIAILSNDAHPVPSNPDGSSPVLTGAVSTLSILLGNDDISSFYSVSATPSSGITGSLSTRTYTVTGMSADTGYVDFTATRAGWPTFTKRFSIAKQKQGLPGSQGTDAPVCLGLFSYAEHAALQGMEYGSLAVFYSENVSERGIYQYNASSWNKLPSPTPDQLSRTWLYVLDAVQRGYGVSSHYIGASTAFETLMVRFLYLLKMKLESTGAIFSGGYDEYGNNPGGGVGAFIGGDGRFFGVGASFNSADILSLNANLIKTIVSYKGSWVDSGTWGAETAFTLSTLSGKAGSQLFSTPLADGGVLVVGRGYASWCSAIVFNSSGVEVSNALYDYDSIGPVCCFSSGKVLLCSKYSSSVVRFTRETNGVWAQNGSITAPGYINAIGMCAISNTAALVVAEVLGSLYELIINEDGSYSGFTFIGNDNVYNYHIALARRDSGEAVMIYTRYSDHHAIATTRNTSGAWGSWTDLVADNVLVNALAKRPDNSLVYYFVINGNPRNLYSKTMNPSGTWGSNTHLWAVGVSTEPGVAASVLGNGKTLLSYVIASGSDAYFRYRRDNSYFSSIPIGDIQTQVGAGIIEVGQNTNGIYIKFSEGTLIQYSQVIITIPASSGPSGGYAYQYDFAIPFVGSKPCLSIGASEGGPPPGGARFEVYSIGAETTKWGCAISNNWSSSLYCEIKMMAIGRWK